MGVSKDHELSSSLHCKDLYVFDDQCTVETACRLEEKCGAYMYLGLQTFVSATICVDTWNLRQSDEDSHLQVLYYYDSELKKCMPHILPKRDPIPQDHFKTKRECILQNRSESSSSCGCGRNF